MKTNKTPLTRKGLLRYALSIFCSVLIIIGMAYLAYSAPGATTIGESISTTNLTASGNLQVGGNATTTGDLAVSGTSILATTTITRLYSTIIDAFTLVGKLTAGDTEIEGSNFDINGGYIDGTPIGAGSATSGVFTTLSATATSTLATTTLSGDLDLNLKQIKNVVLEKLSNFPSSPVEGQMFWSTATSTPYWYDATNSRWRTQSHAATLVVAASDSRNKEKADYVCDGTDDQVEIQAAVDALASTRGTIVLLEGTYTFSAPVTIIKSGIIIRGMGRFETDQGVGATQIRAQTGVSFQSFFDLNFGGSDFGSIQDLTLSGNALYQPLYGIYFSGSADDVLLRSVYVRSVSHAVYVHGRVTNLHILDCFLEKVSYAIYIDSSTPSVGIKIQNCVLASYQKTVYIENPQDRIIIAGNDFSGATYNAIYLKDTSGGIIIANNHLVGWPVTNSTVEIVNSTDILIEGNKLYGSSGNNYGVGIDSTSDMIFVTGNIFKDYLLGSVSLAAGANLNGRIYDSHFGTATISSGSTYTDVSHGLSVTPATSTIAVSPTNNLGNATKFWVSNVGSSTFKINVDADPGATTATFSWQIGSY